MFAATLLTAFAISVPPAEADLKKRAEELVAHLADPAYRQREKAARELLDIGYPARDAVLAGQKSSDTEVSDRCRKLYPAIWRHDLEKRVQKFLDQPDGLVPDDLPGAGRWIKIAGDGKQSRKLYAQMVKSHPELLLEVELNPERLRQVYLDFVKNVYGRVGRSMPASSVPRPGPIESEVLLFLFLGATGDVRQSTAVGGASSSYYSQFLNSPYLVAQLNDESGGPFRKLYAGWLEKERYSIVLRRGIDVAANNKVRECAPVLLKIAGDAGTLVTARATALLGFGKVATKDDLPSLEPFLKDKLEFAALAINGDRWSVQVRDVALGAAVQLVGQKLADFGFEREIPAGMVVSIPYIYFAFESDEKRDAAHQKWREWVEKNLSKK